MRTIHANHLQNTPSGVSSSPAAAAERASYPLQATCIWCGKRIVAGGRCYTCATGRPRRLLRPEELAGSRPAVVPAA